MTPKKFALNLATQAGKIITKYFNADYKTERKQDDSPVTIADTTINQLVLDGIKKKFPDHGFIGEEGGSFNQKAEYIWSCDPLDGTVPFVAGLPTCAFSLALLHNGMPILGVINNPLAKRQYFVEQNKGAFLNSKPIQVSKINKINKSSVGVCVWSTAQYDITDTFKELVKLDMDVETGSTAYLGALVANGQLIGQIWPGVSPWDFPAVKIIVEEAGGKVTDIFGNNQRYDKETKGGLASNGLVHDQLIKIIQKTVPTT